MKNILQFAIHAILVFMFSICASCSYTHANDSVVDQKKIGNTACGPCAIFNALVNGSQKYQNVAASISGNSSEEKVKTIIAKFASSPSSFYNKKFALYHEGMQPDDMTIVMNNILSSCNMNEKVKFMYLNSEDGETPPNHLRRVHEAISQSIQSGLPPIIVVRSFAAQKGKNDDYFWCPLVGHAITVIGVEKEVDDNSWSFRFKYADSGTGQADWATASVTSRLYAATSTGEYRDDGNIEWTWLSGAPYLVVDSPSFGLGIINAPWYQRTVVTLTGAVVLDSK